MKKCGTAVTCEYCSCIAEVTSQNRFLTNVNALKRRKAAGIKI